MVMRRQSWLFLAMAWSVLVLLQLSSSFGSYHRQSPMTTRLSRSSRMILMAKSLLLAFRHRGVEVSAAAIPGVATTGGNWRQLDASTEAADSSSDFPTDDGKLTLSSVSAKVRGKDGVCNVAVPDIINNDDDGDEYDYNDDFDEDDDDDEKVFLRVTATGLMSVSSARRKYMTIKVENMHPTDAIKVLNVRVEREKTKLVKSKSGVGNVGQEWEGEIDIPQQLHISNEFRNGFTVNPGERVNIPMRFLARFPEQGTQNRDNNDENNNSRWIDVDKLDASFTDQIKKEPQPHSSSSFSQSSGQSRSGHFDLANLLGRDITKVLLDGKPLIQPCTRGRRYNDKDPPSHDDCDYRRDNIRVDNFVDGYGDTFEVSTKITIETSSGFASFPFTATTIRENGFRIPDSIKFYHSSFSDRNTGHGQQKSPSMDEASDLDDRPPSALPSSSPESITSSMENLRNLGGFTIHGRLVANDDGRDIVSPEPSESYMGDSDAQVGKSKDYFINDCFDLYLSNPRTTELNITDVSVSKPEFMGVKVNSNRLFSDEMDDSNQHSLSSVPSHTIRQWTKDEPLTIQPGASDVYFLTICTKYPDTMEDATNDSTDVAVSDIRWSPEANHPDRDLGLLQIRINDEYEFAIVLEHSDIAQTAVAQAKSEDSADPNAQQMTRHKHVSFLQSIPERLDFLLLSVSSPGLEHHFSLKNLSPDPIRIMSAAVLIDVQDGRDADSEALGLQVDLRLNGENIFEMISSGSGLGHFVVQPFSTLEDIFTLECSLDPSSAILSGARVGDFEFHGTIIVRGTEETGIRFDEWREDMRRNPYRDDHMLVELPFSISIVKPRVDAIIDRSTHPYPQLFASQGWDSTAMAVSFLFFPMTTFDAEKNTQDSLPHQSYVGSNKIEHDLRISSNVANAINLEGGRVIDSEGNSTDSICARFNVTKMSSVTNSLAEGSDEIGHLSLVYRFDIFKRSDTQQTFMYPRSGDDLNVPKTCFLEIITSCDEEFGPFQIPLVVFPGNLELSAGTESIDGPTPGVEMGFDNLMSWTKNSDTGLGNSLIKNLGTIVGGKVKDRSDLNMLASYIRRLTKDKARKIKSRFYPVLLNMGTIDNGKIAKAPLYFTNLNPIPVHLSIDVGDVEGMSISLSRIEGQSLGDGNSLLDALPTYGTDNLIEEGKFEGHPIAGLLEFLSSDDQSSAFMSSFNFRDAVDYDADAVDRFPFLAFLHEWYSSATFHRSPSPNNYDSKLSTGCEDGQPPPYTTSETIDGDGRAEGMLGPMMLSSNGKRIRALKECSRRKTFSVPNRSTIKIPPGGKARLEIQIRGPPQAYLDNDISQLLATGLVLSTNFGGVMPIFVEFEALQGQLYGSLIDSTGNESASVDIPVHLSWDINREKIHQSMLSMPQQNYLSVKEEKSRKAPLLLHSSFTSPIRLQTIESCNPWFQFSHNGSEEDDRGVISEEKNNVGFVETMVDCSDRTKSDDEIMFPSYYQCALNWLNDRVKLQPDGCGVKATKASAFKHTHLEKVKRSVERANIVLKREYNEKNDIQRMRRWSEHVISKYIKTGRKRGDGVVTNLDIFSVASNNLRVASEHGVSTMSSSLRATIEYASADNTHRQNLSLAVHGVVAQAKLDPPRLFDPVSGSLSILSFGQVAIGATSSLYVPIRNPTSVPVRVRLSVPARNADHNSGRSFLPPFVQNTNVTEHSEWWTGNGDFYLQDDRGDLLKSHHNISIKAGARAHVSLLNPSLQSQSVLLLGCGVRCALRGDENRMKDTPASTGTTHPIGASSAAGITLSGTTWIGSADDNADVSDPILLSGGTSIPYSGGPSAFAIPYAALDEIVIPPFGTAELGPIIFRPPGRYRTLGCTAVRESGARHLNKAKRDMCRDSNFDSVVYLENSLTGLESVVMNGRTRWKRLIFLDQPKEGVDAYGDIEVIDGRETLVFPGIGKSRESIGPFPRAKKILLHNEGDEDMFISRIFLSGDNGARSDTDLSCNYGSFRLPHCSDEYILLEPDESIPIVIEHIPNCYSKKEYVLLNVETVEDRVWSSSLYDNGSNLYESKRWSQTRGYDSDNPFETSTFTLSVGYHMDDTLFSSCVPVTTRSRYLSTMAKGKLSLANETNLDLLAQSDRKGRSSLLVELLLLVIAAGLLSFNTRIRSSSVHGVPPSKAENSSAVGRKNIGKKARAHWNTAFRCFARVDPGSSELQALSKEQMRQVVIGHYKAKGTSPPAALANASIFTRDRRAIGGSSARQRTREAAGTERLRTLSDALFQNASASKDSSLGYYMPVGLGWKTALNRGVVAESAGEMLGLVLTSKNLLQERKRLLYQEKAVSDDRPPEPELCDEEAYESKDVDSNKNVAASEMSPKSKGNASATRKATKIDNKALDASNEMGKDATELNDGDSLNANLSEKRQSKIADKVVSKPGEDGANKKNPAIVTRNPNSSDAVENNDEENSVMRNKSEKAKKQQGKDSASPTVVTGQKGDSAIVSRNNGNEPIDKTSVTSDSKRGRHERPGVRCKDENSGRDSGSHSTQPKKKKNDKQSLATDGQKTGRASNSKRTKGEHGSSPPVQQKITTGPEKSSRTKGKSEKQSSLRQAKKQTKKGANDAKEIKVKQPKDKSNEDVSSSPPLRPPPGLAPPPGFGSASTSLSVAAGNETLNATPASSRPQPTLETMLNSALSNPDVDLNAAVGSFQPMAAAGAPSGDAATNNMGGSDLLLGLPETSRAVSDHPSRQSDAAIDELFSTVLPSLTSTTTTSGGGGPSGPTASSSTNTIIPQSSFPDILDRSSSENGFDVMDFLDSILNEGSLRTEDDDQIDQVGSSRVLGAGAGLISSASDGQSLRGETNESNAVAPGSSAPVLENPWASDGTSRAEAYGISFDDGEGNQGRPSSSSTSGVTRSNATSSHSGGDEGDINDASAPIFGALSESTASGSLFGVATTAMGTTTTGLISNNGSNIRASGADLPMLLTPAALLSGALEREDDHEDNSDEHDDDEDVPNLLSSFYAFGDHQKQDGGDEGDEGDDE